MILFQKQSPEEKFWEWFTKNEQYLYNFQQDQERVFKDLSEELSKIHPDLVFEFGPVENEARIFILSADGLKEAFPFVEKLYACAPNNPKWKIIKFRPRSEPCDLIIHNITLHPSDISVTLEQDGQKVGLSVFVKGLADRNDQAYTHGVYIMLDFVLGEYDMETKVGFIEIYPNEKITTVPKIELGEFARAFDDFYRVMSN